MALTASERPPHGPITRRWPQPHEALPLAGAALLGLLGCAADPQAPGRGVQNVVVFTIDTLRADQLGAYGGRPGVSPHFDRLADESLLFERAYSQASITHPSLTSMLTGLLPPQHGIHVQTGRMREGVVPIPVLLSEAGIATAQFTANLCRLQQHPGNVFHDGWDVRFCGMLDDPDDYQDQWLWDKKVVDGALAWLEGREGPFFAWLHLMDPHAEHRPPPHLWDWENDPPRERFEQYRYFVAFEEQRTRPPEAEYERLWALYRAQITGADEQLGRFLAALDSRADAARTALIVSSDHGEELFESWARYDHGFSMSEGALHIPLLLRAPGLAADRAALPVELLQVAPTVLELFGLEPPYEMAGPSLLAQRPSRGYALSYCERISTSIRTARHRYWWRHTPEPLRRPPGHAPWRVEAPWFQEREVLATYGQEPGLIPTWVCTSRDAEGRRVAMRMRQELESLDRNLPRFGPSRAAIQDPALSRQLADLGYAGY